MKDVSGRHQKSFGKMMQNWLDKMRVCEGMLVNLMANKQARKTSSATMIEYQDQSFGQTSFQSFSTTGISNIGSWRCQELPHQESRNAEM
jgi:hypothetical protein